jgi:hypothetical protein
VAPGAKHNWSFECTVASGGLNTNLDCDDPFPNNEPNIVVDASDPQHMIASSNDYGSCCDQYYTSFNGGTSWSTGNMSTEEDNRTGSDPVTANDVKHHVALHSSLNYKFKMDGEACNGDVVVSPSKDGGLTWDQARGRGLRQGLRPRAAPGLQRQGVDRDRQQPQLALYGRTYVTWTAFLADRGEYVESPIMETHSDDGGKHWTTPQEIGSSASCTWSSARPRAEHTGRARTSPRRWRTARATTRSTWTAARLWPATRCESGAPATS